MKRPRSSAGGTKLPSLAGLAPPGWLSLSITPSASYAYASSWDDEPSAAAVVASGAGEASSSQPVLAPGFFMPLLAASSASAKSVGGSDVASQASGSASGVVGAEPAEVKEEVPVMPAPPEPAWIRAEYFPSIGIPVSRPLLFVGKKTIQESDLSLQQCRFLLPRGDIYHLLRPLLSHDERVVTDIVEPWHRPQKDPASQERVVGKKHGGLPVYVIVDRAGRRPGIEAKLTKWDSGGNIVLKFKPYRDFVDMSGLRLKDRVHIWAFRYGDGDTLHLVISKIDDGGMPQPASPPADGLAAVKVEDDQA